MKKYLSLLASFCVAIGFIGCGGSSEEPITPPEPPTPEVVDVVEPTNAASQDGFERVELSWQQDCSADIKKTTIYWNGRKNSQTVNFSAASTSGKQTEGLELNIAEGEYEGYFKKLFDAKKDENKKWSTYFFLTIPKDDGSEKDARTKRQFKTFTNALEDSNEGYHFDWDEAKFKDKLIGGLFRYEEYNRKDGKIGRSTKLGWTCSVPKIRSGNFKLPEDKLLTPAANTSTDFMNIPDGIDEDIPFN